MTRQQKILSEPVGIFDSGVGGLSVLRAIQKRLPAENLLYLADQAHVPYGAKPRNKVREYAVKIVRSLLDQDAKLIVVACNTASAAALHHLRMLFPHIPFVGMEPAVKPAAEHTRTGVVGVLATPTTFQGELYAATVDRFAKGVTVLQDTCPGLVEQIENGELDTPRTRRILESALLPMMDRDVDRVVMGCTHYPFVIPLIKSIVGEDVEVIDPAPAVARQTERLLRTDSMRASGGGGRTVYVTSGDITSFRNMISVLIGDDSPDVRSAQWVDGQLVFG